MINNRGKFIRKLIVQLIIDIVKNQSFKAVLKKYFSSLSNVKLSDTYSSMENMVLAGTII